MWIKLETAVTKAKAARDARNYEQSSRAKFTEGMSAAAIAAMKNSLKNFSTDKIEVTSDKTFVHGHKAN